MLALAAVLSVMSVLSHDDIPSWRTVYAHKPRPAIHSVDPRPPHCILLNSTKASDRLLTVTGENLLAYGERRLQFLDVATDGESTLFDREVNWKDPRRISIDGQYPSS